MLTRLTDTYLRYLGEKSKIESEQYRIGIKINNGNAEIRMASGLSLLSRFNWYYDMDK